MTGEEQGNRSAQRGFTLIELIVVVTIIGMLAGLAIVNVRHAQRKASENVLKHDLAMIRKALDEYYADKQRYPATLEELVEAKYLRKIPVDPITKSAETWEPVMEEPETGGSDFQSSDPSSSLGPGVSDVKSGAEGETLDDPPVPYSEL